MSTTLTEYEAREQRVKEVLVPVVEHELKRLDSQALTVFAIGAELGQHLEELAKRHKGEEASWLMALCPNMRVADFAANAWRRKKKNPELCDARQLTFALMWGDEAQEDERPSRADGTDITAVLGYSQKLRLTFSKWGDDDVGAWPKSRQDAARRALEPLVELYGKLKASQY